MKKLFVILTAALMVLAVGCTGTNGAGSSSAGSSGSIKTYEYVEPEYEPFPASELPLDERVLGDWYASFEGLMLKLSLSEDGAYVLNIPGEEPQRGTWELSDESMVVLDGDDAGALLPVDDTLQWKARQVFFRREAPTTYQPAEVYAGAKEGDFDGYWKSQFIAVGDGTMLASAFGEATDIYIEGQRAALGGPLFGDVIVDMELKDGALTYAAEGVTVVLALQQDGLLRLTMTADEPVTLYLLPTYVEGVSPAPAE